METQIAKAHIKVKGYKKFVKRIKKMRMELEKLNRTMERTAELKGLF